MSKVHDSIHRCLEERLKGCTRDGEPMEIPKEVCRDLATRGQERLNEVNKGRQI